MACSAIDLDIIFWEALTILHAKIWHVIYYSKVKSFVGSYLKNKIAKISLTN